MKTTLNAAINIRGVDIYDRGFLNTSLIKPNISKGYYYLRIFLPKGTCAFYAGDVNGEQEKYEVLVQKGARLKIVSKDKEYINCILLGTD